LVVLLFLNLLEYPDSACAELLCTVEKNLYFGGGALDLHKLKESGESKSNQIIQL
jgi:hypothetical protein